jgi:hypothetical protein
MIYYAIKNNMAVILVLSWPPDYTPPMAAKDFWRDLAGTYREFGTVLFDLFNEFYDSSRFGHLNTPFTNDQLHQWLGDDHHVGYQTLLNTVREEAKANNICLVGGLDYAYRLEFVNKDFCVKDRPNGNGIVYCSHLYNARGTDVTDNKDGLNGHLYGPPVKDGRTLFGENFDWVRKNFPVMITEFGCNGDAQYTPVTKKEDPDAPGKGNYTCTGGAINPAARDYYKTVIGWANKFGFHYTAWSWWVNNCEPWFPGLIKNLAGDAWNGGEEVQKDLKENPGKGIG